MRGERQDREQWALISYRSQLRHIVSRSNPLLLLLFAYNIRNKLFLMTSGKYGFVLHRNMHAGSMAIVHSVSVRRLCADFQLA